MQTSSVRCCQCQAVMGHCDLRAAQAWNTRTQAASHATIAEAITALEITTRKTYFIVRDYPDDKEAKKAIELADKALTKLRALKEEMEK